MTDEEIINICFNSKFGNIRYSIFNHLDEYREIKEYLENRYNDSYSLKETLVRIYHNIEEHPKCKKCGKDIPFRNKIKIPFGEYCCQSCANKVIGKNKHNRSKKTKEQKEIEKYGKSGLSTREKYKITMMKRYGVDNVMKMNIVNEKRCKTNIERYGGRSPMHSKDVQQTWINNFNEVHGVNYPYQSKKIQEKFINTCLEKYNCEYPAQSKEVQDKYKQTMIKKYGVECFPGKDDWTDEFKEQLYAKRFETMKKNGTLNSSKPEEIIFEKLLTVFPKTIHHYKDKDKYPFDCDFYIPEIDTWIEYQGSMFHNGRPYLGTEEDLEEIEKIKEKSKQRKIKTEKNKTRYDSLIETWTIRDVKKRETAEKNNLNWIEFFSLDEFENWLSDYLN